MPKDPSQVFINVNSDPALASAGSSTGRDAELRYPPEETSPGNTIVNIIQYSLNTIGANSQVLINKDNTATGDAELTYDANTNILTAETLQVGNISTAFSANLGNVSHVKITGGSDGYILKTDGAGNLSWVSQTVSTPTWSAVTGKPTFATVATTGDYNDLSNKPSGMATTTYVDNKIANVTYANLSGTPSLATVATSGSYGDLSNLPNLMAVALSGDYADLANRPSIPSITGLASNTVVDSKISNAIANVTWANLSGAPTLADVATSGVYTDLQYPVYVAEVNLPDAVENEGMFAYVTLTDHAYVAGSSGWTKLSNYSDLDNIFDQTLNTTDDVTFNNIDLTGATITSNGLAIFTKSESGGDIDIYTDWAGNGTTGGIDVWLKHGIGLDIKTDDGTYIWSFDNTGKLTLPINGDIVNSSGVSVLNAFSGDYNDLSNTPTLATVATSGSYNDLSNKPTIPTNLDSLTDVTITSAINGQVLKYNGTSWVNGTDNTTTSIISNGTSSVNIAAANGNITVEAGGDYAWTFNTSGSLIGYNNISIDPAGYNFNLNAPATGAIQFYSDASNYYWSMDSYGMLNLPLANYPTYPNSAVVTSSNNFVITAGANNFVFTSTGNLTVGKKISTETVYATSTGTAIDAASGNIITNQVTGTLFKFLHGANSSILQGNASATTDLTFTLPSTSGTNGQVLSTDGDGNLSWSSGGGGSSLAEPSFTIKTTNFNAESGSRYGVNTTSGVVTATLPSSPTAGDAIYFVDAGGAYATNNLTVDPNGGTIMSASGSMTVSVNNQNFGLMYNGTTWRVY